MRHPDRSFTPGKVHGKRPGVAGAWMIRELDPQERPRERLLRGGGTALSDAELIAVILRTGTRGRSSLSLAHELLEEAGGLAGLRAATAASLKRDGLGDAKAAGVLASVELGRRLARSEVPERVPLDRPDDVARYLALRYSAAGQEVMGALFLDGRNRVLDDCELFRGTLARAAVEPRPILKQALLRDAGGVVLFHTHPSGDPSPSVEDLEFTRRMAEACEKVGIPLVDHLVLGGGDRWVSLRRRGGW